MKNLLSTLKTHIKNHLLNLYSSVRSVFFSRKFRVLLPGILLTALLIILIKSFLSSPAEAVWFNDHWNYRKDIQITYTGNETLTEYQVLVDDLDTATMISNGKLQSDCDDIRFTSSQGKLLDYFIVGDTCNTS
ncbi:MAG: hypothetical protein ACOC4Z_03235, partial [Patescibacteria group bacterium]